MITSSIRSLIIVLIPVILCNLTNRIKINENALLFEAYRYVSDLLFDPNDALKVFGSSYAAGHKVKSDILECLAFGKMNSEKCKFRLDGIHSDVMAGVLNLLVTSEMFNSRILFSYEASKAEFETMKSIYKDVNHLDINVNTNSNWYTAYKIKNNNIISVALRQEPLDIREYLEPIDTNNMELQNTLFNYLLSHDLYMNKIEDSRLINSISQLKDGIYTIMHSTLTKNDDYAIAVQFTSNNNMNRFRHSHMYEIEDILNTNYIKYKNTDNNRLKDNTFNSIISTTTVKSYTDLGQIDLYSVILNHILNFAVLDEYIASSFEYYKDIYKELQDIWFKSKFSNRTNKKHLYNFTLDQKNYNFIDNSLYRINIIDIINYEFNGNVLSTQKKNNPTDILNFVPCYHAIAINSNNKSHFLLLKTLINNKIYASSREICEIRVIINNPDKSKLINIFNYMLYNELTKKNNETTIINEYLDIIEKYLHDTTKVNSNNTEIYVELLEKYLNNNITINAIVKYEELFNKVFNNTSGIIINGAFYEISNTQEYNDINHIVTIINFYNLYYVDDDFKNSLMDTKQKSINSFFDSRNYIAKLEKTYTNLLYSKIKTIKNEEEVVVENVFNKYKNKMMKYINHLNNGYLDQYIYNNNIIPFISLKYFSSFKELLSSSNSNGEHIYTFLFNLNENDLGTPYTIHDVSIVKTYFENYFNSLNIEYKLYFSITRNGRVCYNDEFQNLNKQNTVCVADGNTLFTNGLGSFVYLNGLYAPLDHNILLQNTFVFELLDKVKYLVNLQNSILDKKLIKNEFLEACIDIIYTHEERYKISEAISLTCYNIYNYLTIKIIETKSNLLLQHPKLKEQYKSINANKLFDLHVNIDGESFMGQLLYKFLEHIKKPLNNLIEIEINTYDTHEVSNSIELCLFNPFQNNYINKKNSCRNRMDDTVNQSFRIKYLDDNIQVQAKINSNKEITPYLSSIRLSLKIYFDYLDIFSTMRYINEMYEPLYICICELTNNNCNIENAITCNLLPFETMHFELTVPNYTTYKLICAKLDNSLIFQSRLPVYDIYSIKYISNGPILLRVEPAIYQKNIINHKELVFARNYIAKLLHDSLLSNNINMENKIQFKIKDTNIFIPAIGEYANYLPNLISDIMKNTKKTINLYILIDNDEQKSVVNKLTKGSEFIRLKYVDQLNNNLIKKSLNTYHISELYKFVLLDDLFKNIEIEELLILDADLRIVSGLDYFLDYDLEANILAATPMCDEEYVEKTLKYWKHDNYVKLLNNYTFFNTAVVKVNLNKFKKFYIGHYLRLAYDFFGSISSYDHLEKSIINFIQDIVKIKQFEKSSVYCDIYCTNKKDIKIIDYCKTNLKDTNNIMKYIDYMNKHFKKDMVNNDL